MKSCFLHLWLELGWKVILQASSDNSYCYCVLSSLFPSPIPCKEWQKGKYMVVLIYDTQAFSAFYSHMWCLYSGMILCYNYHIFNLHAFWCNSYDSPDECYSGKSEKKNLSHIWSKIKWMGFYMISIQKDLLVLCISCISNNSFL